MSGIIFLAITGCRKAESFSPVPQIQDVRFVPEEASLHIDFTDGDGDMGFREYDTIPPYNFVEDPENPTQSSNRYYYNIFLEYFQKVDGEWEPVQALIPFYYRAPDITPTGQNKVLEGTIKIDLSSSLPFPSDTSRFDVSIADRALNESNVFSSGEIVLP